MSNLDNNGIDDSEDDSEDDYSEDSDQDEDHHDRHHDRRENSTPWASSPPLPSINRRNTQHAESTASFSTGSTWHSSAALESSSSDRVVSSPLSERPGKLRSVTKVEKRRAQETSRQTILPSRRAGAQSSSSANVDQNPSSLRQKFLAKEANSHRLDPPTSSMGDSSSTNHDHRRSPDEFDHEPLEQDSRDLLAKYDKTVPRANRALGGAGVADATAAGDAGRQGISPEHRADGIMPQHPQSDRSDMSSVSVGSSGRKRAAPDLLLSPRPSRHCFASSGNAASNPMNILPDRSVSAAAPRWNTAPIDDTPRATAVKTFLEISTTAKIGRYAVHSGCCAGLPCRNHKGSAPVPSNPQILIYHNTLSKHRRATLEEAEYIFSQANCFWARRFTVLWAEWCRYKGGIENEKRSQVEWLMSYPDVLVKAAKECCPKDWITID